MDHEIYNFFVITNQKLDRLLELLDTDEEEKEYEGESEEVEFKGETKK